MKSCLFLLGVVVRRCNSSGYGVSSRLARQKNPLISLGNIIDETDYQEWTSGALLRTHLIGQGYQHRRYGGINALL